MCIRDRLRPGRFDRQVVVDLPDIRGREAILKVHMRKVPLDADVDPLVIARGTPGFSGADLANLINEAALFAARYSDKKIDQSHLDLAKDKIMMGAERKSMILSEEQKRITDITRLAMLLLEDYLQNMIQYIKLLLFLGEELLE